MRILTLIGGRNRKPGPPEPGPRESVTWARGHDRAVVEALRDTGIRRLARATDGLSGSSMKILADFTDALRTAEDLPVETADL
ncbi:hypothetical protein [Nocardia macrotermitis]|uniref:hypothetical protein n=1 Tax=Nocardia macrotermitis TaxID=2585198 RepID=UPI001297D3BE|nr:hypothetical protein [Nocardia macrotermitis]